MPWYVDQLTWKHFEKYSTVYWTFVKIGMLEYCQNVVIVNSES